MMRVRDHIFVSLFAFGVTVALAIALRWQTQDFVWGLWASSLWVGCAIFLKSLVYDIVSTKHRNRKLFLAISPLLVLAFGLHFIPIHWLDSVLLNRFVQITDDGVPVPNFLSLLQWTFVAHWPLIAMSVFDRATAPSVSRLVVPGFSRTSGRLLVPYLDVARIHVLIGIYTFLNGLYVGEWVLYLLLLFNFLPWQAVLFRHRARYPYELDE